MINVSIYIYIYIYIYILCLYEYISWLTIIKGNLIVPFSIGTTPRCKEGCYSFLLIVPLNFDPYLIMLSVKHGGMKYHFLSLWCDSTWDWILVSQGIGKHSKHYANGPGSSILKNCCCTATHSPSHKPLKKTNKITGYCWVSKNELISCIFLWTPTHGHTNGEWPAKTYIYFLCADTRCSLEDLSEVMDGMT